MQSVSLVKIVCPLSSAGAAVDRQTGHRWSEKCEEKRAQSVDGLWAHIIHEFGGMHLVSGYGRVYLFECYTGV